MHLLQNFKKTKKNVKIIIGLGIFLILVGSLIFLNKIVPSGSQEKTEIFQAEVKEEVNLVIDYGEEEVDSFQSDFKKGMTVFDLLKEEAEKSGLVLKTKNYDIGIFIESIGDKKNGQDGKYWLYYINGEMPMVSADKKELKTGDKVEFKFEKSPF